MRMATCHPELKHHAKDLCGACYSKHLLDTGYREKHQQQVRAFYDKVRQEMYDALGDFCSCCKETEKVFLSLQHIKNNGAEHRRRVGGRQESTYSALLDARRQGFPKEEYTVYCMNCQRGALQPGGCPHKRAVTNVA